MLITPVGILHLTPNRGDYLAAGHLEPTGLCFTVTTCVGARMATPKRNEDLVLRLDTCCFLLFLFLIPLRRLFHLPICSTMACHRSTPSFRLFSPNARATSLHPYHFNLGGSVFSKSFLFLFTVAVFTFYFFSLLLLLLLLGYIWYFHVFLFA